MRGRRDRNRTVVALVLAGLIGSVSFGTSRATALASPAQSQSESQSDSPPPSTPLVTTPPTSSSTSLPDRSGPVVRDVADPALVEAIRTALGDMGPMVVAGTLLQSATRPASPDSGADRIEEWFVETADGRVLAIAVPLLASDPSAMGGEGRRGRRVELRAAPFGTLEAVARDGERRQWPLLIGRPVATAGVGSGAVVVVAATLLAAGGWFVLRRRLAARRGVLESSTRPHVEGGEPPMDLPKDPAEALAVLATRAGDRETES